MIKTGDLTIKVNLAYLGDKDIFELLLKETDKFLKELSKNENLLLDEADVQIFGENT